MSKLNKEERQRISIKISSPDVDPYKSRKQNLRSTQKCIETVTMGIF